ncbi:MAG: oxygen-dependent coproporphyrinogen oxidase [Bacteroidia bacterium]|nr:oxygen-dependent coproporphyrinogen oxidase [Bacteroidia bacterium]
MIDKEAIASEFMYAQDRICSSLELLDGSKTFHEDPWVRPEGGGGRSRIIERGKVIEKGGVNFSKVFGEVPAFMKAETKKTKEAKIFFATGVSIVIHPLSPWVPIIHMNIRYFENDNGDSWFGGGIDLTPHYVDPVDAKYFHQSLKELCSLHQVADYSVFKKEADDYFFIRHREETRGIGGIFFDHLRPGTHGTKEQLLAFVLGLANLFSPLYTELVQRKMKLSYGEPEKKWQHLRRGRYVEFNLVYDRGTKFGLETNGRTESILMSLPPIAYWEYNFVPGPASKEHETTSLLRKGIDW